jgi:two-component system sensor histidine kinase KdpD
LFDGSLKHSETTSGDGKRNMGLGLSVCLAIVRAHGGTMEAQNLPDGAEVSFRLPLLT